MSFRSDSQVIYIIGADDVLGIFSLHVINYETQSVDSGHVTNLYHRPITTAVRPGVSVAQNKVRPLPSQLYNYYARKQYEVRTPFH